MYDINCPCSNGRQPPPSYVGSNYHCESAYQGECQMVNFFVIIHSGVVNSEAMRAHQGTNDEDTPIQLLELCVQ